MDESPTSLTEATGSVLETTAPPQVATSERPARIVYILYLVSLVVGVTAIAGLVIAYANVARAPEALKTHFRMQIRTFWIGLLYSFFAWLVFLASLALFLLAFVGHHAWPHLLVIGSLPGVFGFTWFAVRCVKGLRSLGRREAYPNPSSWRW